MTRTSVHVARVVLTIAAVTAGCTSDVLAPPKPVVAFEPVPSNPTAVTKVISTPPRVSGKTPDDIDLGETNCSESYDQIMSSPTTPLDHYLAEFPEVVWIDNIGLTAYLQKGSSGESCTGTVIGESWVLTAAHCFVDPNIGTKPGVDLPLRPEQPDDVRIVAGAAVLLEPEDRNRSPSNIVVHAGYGELPDGTIRNDLAIIELNRPYPTSAIPPARLVTKFSNKTTILGYGYQNRGSGHLYHLGIGWPEPVTQMPKAYLIQFSPVSQDSFCQGDSGGPVFAARLRGCKSWDLAGEPHPHPLEGVMSYIARRT